MLNLNVALNQDLHQNVHTFCIIMLTNKYLQTWIKSKHSALTDTMEITHILCVVVLFMTNLEQHIHFEGNRMLTAFNLFSSF